MVDAVPLEEHLPGLDVQLLDDALPGYAILGASDGGEVPWHRVVDRKQCCVLRADLELVVVPVVAVGSPEPCYLAVGAIEDHVLALVLAWCFHPSEYGLAPVACPGRSEPRSSSPVHTRPSEDGTTRPGRDRR